jgi:hypothetical protein
MPSFLSLFLSVLRSWVYLILTFATGFGPTARKSLLSSKGNLHHYKKCIPIFDLYKIKSQSDGTLHKPKTHHVVRGDLQNRELNEDKWSPTASIQALQVFLGHAAHLQVCVKQLDFIGIFPKLKSEVESSLIFLQSTLKLSLQKSMYSMTLSGKKTTGYFKCKSCTCSHLLITSLHYRIPRGIKIS